MKTHIVSFSLASDENVEQHELLLLLIGTCEDDLEGAILWAGSFSTHILTGSEY